MSEFNSALGLLQLRDVDAAISRRQQIDLRYRERLRGVRGIDCLRASTAARSNNAYFPIFVRPQFAVTRDALYHQLRRHGVLVRRYFYPLISSFGMYAHLPSAEPSNLPNATQAAAEVICLPIYPHLEFDQVDRVADLIIAESNSR